ncbi:MAG: UbiX family flavin prenyltransferase [Lachnospiraceae bacterium]|nr:UbiX family flavin prenyltransferase [Lachnospiraceae bacterium]
MRIIVGISGASGAPIAIELLKSLREESDVETHLVYSAGAVQTIRQETISTLEELEALADEVYDCNNIGGSIASGSYQMDAMIVVPCSMKTLAGIVSGYSDNLLLRAADVTLKERRKLILVTRECPLSTIHLRNMLEISNMGGIILPPVLSYYNHPETIEDATKHIVGKIMDTVGLDYKEMKRWS